ncbi:16S rRNA (adenine(1518)-N(6)/adenine(1519)-N(6))-dimethyltransferase RsmA [Candidatus Mesenet endosymbiont of Agriotes lineatus]|uniref:16S rRNA (adenine(1518)-N(6)/adenine(1519)-N(6))- dimethyltransferase RsmA n=1 Tax=Candidatus Mesenet endosymbiont of Agriotes lineatus TaxID=3077948 RepID=UPI003977BA19
MIKPKKKLGQNFILSSDITDKIAALAGDLSEFNVIEVGPGFGSLTRSILKCSPKYLLSIEKDESLILKHSSLIENYVGKYQILNADALHVKERELVDKPVKVIANLPYNVSVVLLLKWLEDINFFTSLTLMFQKEVADRIVATPNSKSYGRLSILTQLFCDVKKEFDLKPEVFFPKPKVDSAVVTITPLPSPRFSVDICTLKKVMNAVFNKRRKMLSSSLKEISHNTDALLNATEIEGSKRPEDLNIEQFCKLANALYK